MSGDFLSAVSILPDAHKVTGDKIAVGMDNADVGAETYSVPLSATGEDPPTHWGTHSWVEQEWADQVEAAIGGTLPDVTWEDYGLTEVEVTEAFAAMQLSTKPDGQHDGHFDDFIATLGLQRIQPERPGR